jgi:hypothetical protein
MADSYETDTVVRTFDRAVSRLKSSADTMRQANRGSATFSESSVATVSGPDSVASAWAVPEVPDPATTISAALGGTDVSGSAPKLLFLGSAAPGPDGFRISGAAGGAAHDVWTLLTLREQSMSSFVPDHGLRIGGTDKTPRG